MVDGNPSNETGDPVMDDALMTEWRVQTEGWSMNFANPEPERCRAITRANDPFNGQSMLWRCGKRAGHERRHECSDFGGISVKWDGPESSDV